MKAYFQFTRKEKIGVVGLSAIMLLMIILLQVNNNEDLPEGTEVNLGAVEYVTLADSSSKKDNYANTSFHQFRENKQEYELSTFDPNELNLDGWKSLGFTEKQANSIVNFRAKYGPFEDTTDVKKMYVISDEKFAEIAPYMVFKTDSARAIIEINTANQEELESIKGIGPFFAKRVLQYRDSLGGYLSNKQFKEVTRLSEEGCVALTQNIIIDPSQIHRIEINSATKDQLRKHPYLNDWAIVTEIISRRDKEQLTDLNFLTDKKLMTKEEVSRVLPYVSFAK